MDPIPVVDQTAWLDVSFLTARDEVNTPMPL